MSQAPYDVVFFDMDGTLLPIEVRDFLVPYYELLMACCVREGWNPEHFRDSVNKSIFGMMNHPATETNDTAFWRMFFDELFKDAVPSAEEKKRLYWFFDEFYRTTFNHAGDDVAPNPTAQRVIATLHEKGYPLYLTTMPMFPLAAIEWRMKWAACDIGLFSRVTTFDNSTWTKPHVGYYEENVALADVPANRILMVGNNTEDDLNCLQVGMDAFLITDYLINPNDFDVSTVKHGSLEDFAAWVDELPPCTSTHALGWRDRADTLRADGEVPGWAQ